MFDQTKKISFFAFLLSLSLSSITATANNQEQTADVKLTEQVAKDEEWSVNAPQGQFTTANIDVNQGTWMNVDISPDGKTLVFDLLGDIYTLPIAGGEARALMTDIAWQMQPRFSPNGEHIAFTSDQGGGDNLWLMNNDGSNHKAVSSETFRLVNSPAWSPDGNFIVGRKHFTGSRSLGAGEVWLYHKTGGSGVMLTKRPNEQKDLGEPAYSHDGKYVYFSQDATPGKTFHYSKDSEKGIYKIKRLTLETGEITVVISGKGGAIRPVPSPDGKFLAFISRDDFQSNLYLYDLKNGQQRLIFENLDRDMQETWAIHGVYPNMAWLPNSKGMVFWSGGVINRLDIETMTTSIIPFHVKTTKKIQTALRFQQDINQDNFTAKMLRDVEISPDGKKVVYESMGYIYLRNIANGQAKGKAVRLTKQQSHYELNPSFSRDGKQIVYSSWHDQKLGSIRVVSARGGKGKIITKEPGKYIEPRFSPDGKMLVYRKVSGGFITDPVWGLMPGIYITALKGGEAKLITDTGVRPHFGNDNDIVYVLRNDEKTQLVKLNLTENTEKVLYQGKFATEYRVSPDSNYLAFAERFKVFVTPFIESGQAIDTGPKADNIPVKKLSTRAGEGINWNGQSNQLYWSLGADLYQATVAQTFEISEQQEKSSGEPLKTYLGYAKKKG